MYVVWGPNVNVLPNKHLCNLAKSGGLLLQQEVSGLILKYRFKWGFHWHAVCKDQKEDYKTFVLFFVLSSCCYSFPVSSFFIVQDVSCWIISMWFCINRLKCKKHEQTFNLSICFKYSYHTLAWHLKEEMSKACIFMSMQQQTSWGEKCQKCYQTIPEWTFSYFFDFFWVNIIIKQHWCHERQGVVQV